MRRLLFHFHSTRSGQARSPSPNSPTYAKLAFLGFLLLGLLFARVEAKLGIPSYTVFEPEMIGTDEGINAMAVDGLGRLVVSSGDKLITFDGAAWKTHQVENLDEEPVTQLLALEYSKGRLFVSSDIGIHEVQFTRGDHIRLIPLMRQDQAHRADAVNLTDSLSHLNKVHFYSFKIHVSYDLETGKAAIRECGDANFEAIKSHGQDLYSFFESRTFKNDPTTEEWVELPRSGPDPYKKRVFRAAESWGKFGILLATNGQTISQFQHGSYTSWPSEIETLTNKSVFELKPLSDKHVAASVKSEGIFILNQKGEVVQSLSVGLDHRFGRARNLFSTNKDTLWASVGNSVVRIHLFDSLTKTGPLIPSALHHPKIYKWKNQIFIESEGKLDRAHFFKGGGLRGFRPYGRSIPENIDTSYPIGDVIICAGRAGLFSLKSIRSFDKISDEQKVDLIFGFKDREDLFIAATNEAFLLFEKNGDQWEQTQRIGGAPSRSYFYHHSPDGSIWIEHGMSSMSRIFLKDGIVSKKTYTVSDGLGESWTNIFTVRGKTYFSSMNNGLPGVWNPETEKLETQIGYMADLAIEVEHFTRPFNDKDGNIWMIASNGDQHVYQTESKTSKNRIIHNAADVIGDRFLSYGVSFDQTDIWIAGDDEVFIYTPTVPGHTNEQTPLTINRIYSHKTGTGLFRRSEKQEIKKLEIPYSQNSISVQLVSQAVSSKKYPLRQYRVKGIHSHWQKVPNGTDEVVLADLREGSYEFEARASFDGERFSPVDHLAFEIWPPFYRSTTAYLLYAISAIALFLTAVMIFRKRAERKNIILSRLVAERTVEVQNANTQLNRANAELKELYHKAKAADRAKSAFLAVISHEMRTPLNSVIAPCEILETGTDDEEQLEFINLIKDNGKRLLNFVDEVLLFASNDSKLSELDFDDFDINCLMEDLVASTNPQAVKKGLAVELSPESNVVPNTLWNGSQKSIHQILSNLIDNSIKYTESGKVILTAQIENGAQPRLTLSVCDTGIGIPKEKLEQIFEPFFQVDDSITRPCEGVGLGLSICQQLANKIDASIQVTSALGKGSCFTLIIPEPQTVVKEHAHAERISTGQVL